MPSHRADTPADAPSALRSRSSAHPTHPPLQRRRDLRARGAVPAGHATAAVAPTAVLPAQRPATTGSADAETVAVPVLDALFLAAPGLGIDAAPEVNGTLEPVQPLRRLRLGSILAPRTTRRAAKAAAERAERRGTAALPQAGIAGALGIATIAVPLSGALGLGHGTGASTAAPHTAAAAALTPLPPFPLVATSPVTALADGRLLPQESPVAEVPSALRASRIRVAAGRASRSAPRSVLPGCDGKVPDVGGIENGRLPASMLCTLWNPDRQLRSDAAVAIAKLNVLYAKRFGHPMCFNDAYRSLLQQYRIKALRGGYAARPGTSEHGWGLAADLCDGVDDGAGSPTYDWLRANAPAYGWQNPTWARRGGSGPYEPWHWEYVPGEQGQTKGD